MKDMKLRNAIVTLSARNYLPGLLRAIESLLAHNDPIDIVVISEDIEQSDLPEGVIIHRPNIDAYVNIPNPPTYPKMVYYILDSLLFDYDRITWIGADEIILGDLSEVTGANNDLSVVLELTDNGFDKMFNDAMFSIMPKRFDGLFSKLISIAERGGHRLCEMSVLNDWVNENNIDVTYLDNHIDVIKRAFVYNKEWWNANKHKIKAVHYVGKPKPWDGDEHGYEALHEFWRNYKPGDELPDAV